MDGGLEADRERAHALLRASGIQIGGIYRHYREGELCVVVALSLREGTLEPLVTCFRAHERDYGTWGLDEFTGRVVPSPGARFEGVGG